MYQDTIYICISWYSKICWFPMEKCWCYQNSRGVSRDSNIFLDILWLSYNCAKFHHCRICVTDFREVALFAPPPSSLSSPAWIGLKYTDSKHLKLWSKTKGLEEKCYPEILVSNQYLGTYSLRYFFENKG